MVTDGLVHAGDPAADHTPICQGCGRPCSGDFRALDGEYYHPQHRPDYLKP